MVVGVFNKFCSADFEFIDLTSQLQNIRDHLTRVIFDILL